MAAKIKTEAKPARQDTFRVDPADVKNGRNARMVEAADYAETVRRLAVDLFLNGQLQPVECRRDKDNTLIQNFGFTRKAAVELLRAGFDATDPRTGSVTRFHDPDARLWVKVVDCGPDEAFLRGVKENLERKDTTDLQEALQHQEIRTTMGWTDARIAREYGYTNQNRVAALSKLLTLSEKTKTAVHAGKLALYTALDTLKIDDPEEREAVLDGAVTEKGRVDGALVRKMIRDNLAAKAAPVPDIDTADGPDAAPVLSPSEAAESAAPAKAVKRTLAELKGFIAEVIDEHTVADAGVKELFAALAKWVEGTVADRTLWKQIAELRSK